MEDVESKICGLTEKTRKIGVGDLQPYIYIVEEIRLPVTVVQQ